MLCLMRKIQDELKERGMREKKGKKEQKSKKRMENQSQSSVLFCQIHPERTMLCFMIKQREEEDKPHFFERKSERINKKRREKERRKREEREKKET